MKLYEGWVQSDEDGLFVSWSANGCYQLPMDFSGVIVVGELHGIPVLAWKRRFMIGGQFDRSKLAQETEAVLGETGSLISPSSLRDGTKVLVMS
jgi:hypothetical protein